VFKYFLYW